jgi:hypothetical protein
VATIPDGDARWLAGPDGPLSAHHGPGVIEHLGAGRVRLDLAAIGTLSRHRGAGRVEWPDVTPVLRLRSGAFPLLAGG